jgi:hypothetical protein
VSPEEARQYSSVRKGLQSSQSQLKTANMLAVAEVQYKETNYLPNMLKIIDV